MGCCEYDNEISRIIKGGSKYKVVKRDSAPQSYLICDSVTQLV